MAKLLINAIRVGLHSARVSVDAFRTAWRASVLAPGAQDARKKASKSAGGMPLDQAANILGVADEKLSKELVAERAKTLFELNDVKKGGSVYIQAKVFAAQNRLQEALKSGEWVQEGGAVDADASDADVDAEGIDPFKGAENIENTTENEKSSDDGVEKEEKSTQPKEDTNAGHENDIKR